MSVESNKINNKGKFPLQEPEVVGKIPNGKFIKFDVNTLPPKRRSLALRQIKIYKKKIDLFPHKRSLYNEEINKLIEYEKKGVKIERK